MKICIVSCYLPPKKGGSAEVMGNLIRYMSTEDVVVFGELDEKERKQCEASLKCNVYAFWSDFNLGGRGKRFFILFRWMMVPLMMMRMAKVIRKEKPDAILGVYPDNLYCFAAERIARRFKIPFYSYFHNTYVENRDGFNKYIGEKIQKRIFENSNTVFVMSDGMKRFYEKHYKNTRFASLTHTLNPSLLLPEDYQYTATQKQKYSMVITGNINASNVEGTKRFIEAIKDSDRFELNIYTHVPYLMLMNRGLSFPKEWHKGYIPDGEYFSTIRSYDIIVLVHGFTGAYSEVEYETIFPTRTIPYLLSGKPLFVHAPPKSFLASFVRENECGILVDEASHEAVLKGLDQLTNPDVSERMVRNGQETVKKFHPEVVSSGFLDIVRSQNESAVV